MKKIKTVIEIEIENIKVEERYFNFDFTIKVNGEEKKKDSYNDSYDGETEEIEESLKNGYATQLVMESYSSEILEY